MAADQEFEKWWDGEKNLFSSVSGAARAAALMGWNAAMNHQANSLQPRGLDKGNMVSEHFKDCPDCGHEIPPEMVRGEACENCGHVFNWGPTDDDSDEWEEMEPLFPNGIPDRI